jgi:Flp pilus assembly protein protease CpaA
MNITEIMKTLLSNRFMSILMFIVFITITIMHNTITTEDISILIIAVYFGLSGKMED